MFLLLQGRTLDNRQVDESVDIMLAKQEEIEERISVRVTYRLFREPVFQPNTEYRLQQVLGRSRDIVDKPKFGEGEQVTEKTPNRLNIL